MCFPGDKTTGDDEGHAVSKKEQSTHASKVEAQRKPCALTGTAKSALALQDVVDAAASATVAEIADRSSFPHRCARALNSLEALPDEKRPRATWAMLHRLATAEGRMQYVDPGSGLKVFTATFLKQRSCCGFRCRHCPHSPDSGTLAAVAADW